MSAYAHGDVEAVVVSTKPALTLKQKKDYLLLIVLIRVGEKYADITTKIDNYFSGCVTSAQEFCAHIGVTSSLQLPSIGLFNPVASRKFLDFVKRNHSNLYRSCLNLIAAAEEALRENNYVWYKSTTMEKKDLVGLFLMFDGEEIMKMFGQASFCEKFHECLRFYFATHYQPTTQDIVVTFSTFVRIAQQIMNSNNMVQYESTTMKRYGLNSYIRSIDTVDSTTNSPEDDVVVFKVNDETLQLTRLPSLQDVAPERTSNEVVVDELPELGDNYSLRSLSDVSDISMYQMT